VQSDRALTAHQTPLQTVLHRLTVTPVVTNADLPKLIEMLHAASTELQSLMQVCGKHPISTRMPLSRIHSTIASPLFAHGVNPRQTPPSPTHTD